MAHIYPDGPIPTENPAISSLVDPPFIALYSYVATVGTVFFAWSVYRFVKARALLGAPLDTDANINVDDLRPKQEQAKDESSADGAGVEITVRPGGESSDIRVRFYRASWLGELAFGLLLSISVVLVAITMAVLYDTYWECQLTGVDALCFYGSYPLSGSQALNALAFFGLWVACLVYCAVLLSLKGQLRSFFRLPCSSATAGYVSIKVPQKRSMLMKASSQAVVWARRLKATVIGRSSSAASSITETVPICTRADGTRYYDLQSRRYPIRTDTSGLPAEVAAPDSIRTYGDVVAMANGMSSARAQELLMSIGPNSIPYKPDSLVEGIVKEFATAFGAYSLLVYLYWFWFGYILVGLPLFLVVLVTGFLKIRVTRNGQRTVANLVQNQAKCDVLRDGSWAVLSNDELVQGDVIKVHGDDWVVPCDLAMLQGTCVVNEGSLTGESTPVDKIEIPKQTSMLAEPYRPQGAGKRHALFAGTAVLQTGSPAGAADPTSETLAVVTATAINTSKGGMLSAILYPIQLVFKYDEDLEIVLLILAVYVTVIFVAVFLLLSFREQETTYALSFAYAVFTVSQVVSPLLPIGMIAGHFFSVVRLSQQSVFCTNPARIAISGKTRVFCFDKTGTLTTDNLDFICARMIARSGDTPKMGKVWFPVGSSRGLSNLLEYAMASCHSVSRLGNALVGSQMEVKMVQAIEWDVQPQQDGTAVLRSVENDSLTIIRRFEFDFARQAMGVVVRTASGDAFAFVKGSSESLSNMAKLSSVPKEFASTVSGFGEDGFYTLAMAGKHLGADVSNAEIMEMERADVERDMEMLGLLAFRNELKEDTVDAISALKLGDVRPVMITGDSVQTALYISRKSGMSPPGSLMLLGQLSPNGELAWIGATKQDQNFLGLVPVPTKVLYSDEYYKRLKSGALQLAISGDMMYSQLEKSGDLYRILMFIRVFARASPVTKAKIVQAFVDQGLVVGMCGDGGNDCGALRAAHAGVALSETEASIAAPFTAKTKSCMAVVQLLKEGKCALHTNLATYRFLMIYGQLFGVWKVTGFAYGVLIPLACYLLVDVVALVLLTFAMTCSLPKETLEPRRPTASLFSAYTLASVLGSFFIGVATFLVLQFYMNVDPFYLRWPAYLSNAETFWLNGDNWESTYIFWPVYFNFITSALIFGFGAEFRRPVLTNWPLTMSWAALFALGSYLLLADSNAVTRVFHVASEQFNYPGVQEDIPDSVWADYQAEWEAANPGQVLCFPNMQSGAPCNPGLNFERRLLIYVTILVGLLLSAIWQAFVVDMGGKQCKKCFPGTSSRPVFST